MRPLMLILLLTGCDGGEATPQSCDEMPAGMERDTCYHQEITPLAGAQVDEVIRIAGLIQDPIVRDAAVAAWIEAHNNEVPKERGNALCQILDGRPQSRCMRLLSSPHLYEDRSPVTPNTPNNPPPGN